MQSETKQIALVGIALLAVVVILMISTTYTQDPTQLPIIAKEKDEVKTFESLTELKSFIKENSESNNYGGFGGIMKESADFATTAQAVPSAAGSASREESASDYSETNIQVEGVDEPDIVKNDGKYIYAVTRNKVIIVEAFPAEQMEILSELEFDNSVSNIFVNEDKLIIFTASSDYVQTGIPCGSVLEDFAPCGGYSKSTTNVNIYDISDREDPELETNVELDGDYIEARMIEDYVYVISSKYIQMNHFDLPTYRINGMEEKVAATEIAYFDYPGSSYNFNSISAIDIEDGDVNTKVYLMDQSSNIYVSQNNIYLTYMKRVSQEYQLEKMVEEVYIPLLPSKEDEKINEILDSDDPYYQKSREIQEIMEDYIKTLDEDTLEPFSEEFQEKLEEYYERLQKETEKTVIHKVKINENDIDYRGVGEVPGNVLNQFSMDEHNNYFRIATTTGNLWGGTSLNHLYILNEDLNIVGSVEDLAKGERIYSARFMGNRAYMVTFKKVDPLFVIDLSNPNNPKVLGYLKITGYSDYLHPYDENHVIGIGKETRGGSEQFSWYQGVKISLFDVSDVNNPVEKAKIEIGDRGTDSYALHDHKAFLFNKERELLVIPISLAIVDENQDSPYWNNDEDARYGETVWQGAYVLNINEDDISVRGQITHYDENEEINNWYYGGQKAIQRSLYMDNVLYTISQSRIKANDLNTVYEINDVNLPIKTRDEPVYYVK